ncbi:MAG: F0F1 ATP synthase subunit A, partial [Sphingobacteriales bacterium]
MMVRRVKALLVAVFSLFSVLSFAQPHQEQTTDGHTVQENPEKEGKKFDANEVIFGHVLDAHQFHFFSIGEHHYGINLPVILFEKGRGVSTFSSGQFEHGHAVAQGRYLLVTDHYRHEMVQEGVLTAKEAKALRNESIIAVDAEKHPILDAQVYDFSLTRNVVQMLLALIVLTWILLGVAKRYKQGEGVTTAPKGMQNAIEPVITFVRDEVAKPNLGHNYKKYLPLLLTIFFFILINN